MKTYKEKLEQFLSREDFELLDLTLLGALNEFAKWLDNDQEERFKQMVQPLHRNLDSQAPQEKLIKVCEKKACPLPPLHTTENLGCISRSEKPVCKHGNSIWWNWSQLQPPVEKIEELNINILSSPWQATQDKLNELIRAFNKSHE